MSSEPHDLRERAASYRMGGPSSEHTAKMLDDAADRIDSLLADRARMEKELAALQYLTVTTCFECDHDLRGPYCPACNPDIDAARAEGAAQQPGHIIDGKRFSLHAGDRYRHVKRGSTYTLPFGRAEAMVQCEEPISDEHTLLIYIGDDGMIFARPTHEFFDGRFQPASGQEGSAERDGGDGVPVRLLSVHETDKSDRAEGVAALQQAGEPVAFRIVANGARAGSLGVLVHSQRDADDYVLAYEYHYTVTPLYASPLPQQTALVEQGGGSDA